MRSLSASAAVFSHSTSSKQQKTQVSILFLSRNPATLAPLSKAHKAILVGPRMSKNETKTRARVPLLPPQ